MSEDKRPNVLPDLPPCVGTCLTVREHMTFCTPELMKDAKELSCDLLSSFLAKTLSAEAHICSFLSVLCKESPTLTPETEPEKPLNIMSKKQILSNNVFTLDSLFTGAKVEIIIKHTKEIRNKVKVCSIIAPNQQIYMIGA